jgi:4-diphosphocytidyl-2-C-methyl-D-erythritol kinase
MSSLLLRSPAKLNLYLRVINKRPDGFHNIETLFERIDLHDDIRLKNNSSGKIIISCRHPDVPLGPKNLAYKAAVLLKQQFNIRDGVHIDITKRLPVAAGIAGGSGNGATVLLGLNKLWRLGLSKQQLVALAKKIGSDVAFFVYNTSWALGTNRGDQIKVLDIKNKLHHIIIVPKIKMYSWKVYGQLKLKARLVPTNLLTKKSSNVSILISHLSQNRLKEVAGCLHNDLEGPVFELCPKLLKLKDRLKVLQTLGVMVSGSGPAIYGITENQKDALDIQKVLAKQFSQVFVTKTL